MQKLSYSARRTAEKTLFQDSALYTGSLLTAVKVKVLVLIFKALHQWLKLPERPPLQPGPVKHVWSLGTMGL